jgi:hypothetical protein
MIYDSDYIGDALNKEKARVGELSQDSHKGLHRVRQMTLTEVYQANYYRYVINIFLVTTFVTMLCLTVGAMFMADVLHSAKLTFTIIGFIVLVYILIIMMMLTSMRRRTKTDWNQYYFPAAKTLV